MSRYIARRILIAVPVLFALTIVVFGLMHLVPGSALDARLAQTGRIPQEDFDEFKHQFGLDRSLVHQYGSWVGGVVKGDLGTSLFTNRPVGSRIADSLSVTAELVIMGVLVGVLVAIPLGILSALRQNTWLDYLARLIAIAGLSIPDFAIATVLVLYLSLWFGYLPPVTYHSFASDPLANLEQFILPALIVGFRLSATTMRMMRSSMLEVLRQDYIRTAWAKGLRERTIVVRHAVKNAMIPVVTVIGSQFAFLVGGTVVVELIFGLPGVGFLTLQSVLSRDYAQVQGNVLFLGIVILAANLVVDVMYAWLDPRIRYT